jgi:hypothetical protein
LQVLSASLLSSWLSFWLPWIYSPFPFFMEFRNGVLLQLFECIESTQNEVKRKMMETGAGNDAPKSPARLAREEKVRVKLRGTPRCASNPLSAARPFPENAALRGRRDGVSPSFRTASRDLSSGDL